MIGSEKEKIWTHEQKNVAEKKRVEFAPRQGRSLATEKGRSAAESLQTKSLKGLKERSNGMWVASSAVWKWTRSRLRGKEKARVREYDAPSLPKPGTEEVLVGRSNKPVGGKVGVQKGLGFKCFYRFGSNKRRGKTVERGNNVRQLQNMCGELQKRDKSNYSLRWNRVVVGPKGGREVEGEWGSNVPPKLFVRNPWRRKKKVSSSTGARGVTGE